MKGAVCQFLNSRDHTVSERDRGRSRALEGPGHSLHGGGEDTANGTQQEIRRHLGQTVQQHLQLLPVLDKHGLVLTLKCTGLYTQLVVLLGD